MTGQEEEEEEEEKMRGERMNHTMMEVFIKYSSSVINCVFNHQLLQREMNGH